MHEAQRTIEQLYHEEYGRILAGLIGRFRDFTLAEDALQEAITQALAAWPRDGLPNNPAAWLTTVAQRRAIDRLRRERHAQHQQLREDQAAPHTHDADENEESMSPELSDDRLKLMFTCCHPSLALDAQVALTLRTLGGLTVEQVARAFMVSVPTMAQRLHRAKDKIRMAGIPYAIPSAERLSERLGALLAVLYLIFNEGYSAMDAQNAISNTHHTHADLCASALRLCRVLVDLLPATPATSEARGLLALMLLHGARRAARLDAQGALVLLEAQDRTLWDQAAIREGTALLVGALALRNAGPYQLQAAISAVHAEATRAQDTDWRQIAALYDVLWQQMPQSVIQVNRAVAVGMAYGYGKGLDLLVQIDDLGDYYPYHAARADLLRRSGQREAASEAYQRATELCPTPLERAYLAGQARAVLGDRQ
jgi:RNA polymerase sigma-70 factor, ECF subfamily